MNVLELAKQLGNALAESPEYRKYQAAQAELDAHEAAKVMVRDFRKKQLELERKRLSGAQLLEPLEEELRRLSEVVGLNPYVREYLMAEYEFSQLMVKIQTILGEAIGLEPLRDPKGPAEKKILQ